MDFIKDFIYKGGDVRLTSPYGMRKHPITGVLGMHWGVDTIKRGEPNARLYAPADGVVIVHADTGGRGKRLYIEYPSLNCVILIQHLLSYRVKKGDKVTKGQWIANQGSTGTSTGPHLHLEVMERGFNHNFALAKRFDPLQFFKEEKMEYIVKKGDVLWKIAANYGLTWQELAKYNNLTDKQAGALAIGQVIKIPIIEKPVEEIITPPETPIIEPPQDEPCQEYKETINELITDYDAINVELEYNKRLVESLLDEIEELKLQKEIDFVFKFSIKNYIIGIFKKI